MDITTLQTFFMWCTILNAGLLILISLVLAAGGDFVYWMQSRFFSISREAFNVANYCWVGLYKILVIVFCAVPWLALAIIG